MSGGSNKHEEAPGRHRFQSFSRRISKLKIDPVHRHHHPHEIAGLSSASFFHDGLAKWQDINTSENFTNFAREISPLCDILPQVLHFEDKIVELLVQYMEKRDVFSLEPLLDLLVQFARDLGVRFEKHFCRTVGLVLSLAAKHPAVEVIEWSFTCLAWLFKFLSRLLVFDLRPAYNLVAPLLGRERQKPFVLRFTAEAMSFLVRKAGTLYSKNEEPLRYLVDYALADLRGCKDSTFFSSYQQGLIRLFSTAAKGVTGSTHSCANAVLTCILKALIDEGFQSFGAGKGVLYGIVTSLIHHTEMHGSHPVMQLLRELTTTSSDGTNREKLVAITGDLLIITASVRNGSRIVDWSSLLDISMDVLSSITSQPSQVSSEAVRQLFLAAALILQRSPIELVIPQLRLIVGPIMNWRVASDVLQFCSNFAALGGERFRTMLLPHTERFIFNHWAEFEVELCVILPLLVETGCIGASDTKGTSLSCPQAWQDHIAKAFEQIELSLDETRTTDMHHLIASGKLQGYLDVLYIMKIDSATRKVIQKRLCDLMRRVLQSDTVDDHVANFLLGKGLLYYVHQSRELRDPDPSLWPLLCASAARLATLPVFLQGLNIYIDLIYSWLKGNEKLSSVLVQICEGNLSSPSHEVRVLSLRILRKLSNVACDRELGLLSLALTIEETGLSLESARVISMHVRKLAASYSSVASDPWLNRALPLFCCGLLHSASSQTEKAVHAALVKIAESKPGEENIAEVLFHWLETPSYLSTLEQQPSKYAAKALIAGYEDANLVSLQKTVGQTAWNLEHSFDVLRTNLMNVHEKTPLVAPSTRLHALQTLQELGQVAERRSRLLVPHFIDCFALDDDGRQESANSPLTSDCPATDSTARWSRAEKRAMLKVFVNFTNPRTLYRSSEVYDALLQLLTHGDVEIQKFALEAIFKWKAPGLVSYKENLRNLLDDARFKDEVSSFVRLPQLEDKANNDQRRELMPVLLRLLYGRAIARSGSGAGDKGLESKRRLILMSLADMPLEDLQIFVKVVISPLNSLDLLQVGVDVEKLIAEDRISVRKQIGLLNMIDDMARVLGSKLLPLAGELIPPVLYCLTRSSRSLFKVSSDAPAISEGFNTALMKSIRQSGYRCLNSFFVAFVGFSWEPFMQIIYSHVVNLRLEKLPIETAQSPSGLLQLLNTWSRSTDTALYFARYNSGLLAKIADCVTVASATKEVKLYAIGIVRNIVDLVSSEASQSCQEEIRTKVIQPDIDILVLRVGDVLRNNPEKELLEAAVELLNELTHFVDNIPGIRGVLDASIYLLDQPLRKVNAKTKVGLLQILKQFLPHSRVQDDEQLQQKVFTIVSSLFGFFTDRSSRQNLCYILDILAQSLYGLDEVARLCHDLNSFRSEKVDEPDFDRRINGFNELNDSKFQKVCVRLWPPVLYNLLFFMRDTEEFALRTNASHALRQMVGTILPDPGDQTVLMHHLSRTIMPALRAGLREMSELVRAEHVSLLGQIVRIFPSYVDVRGMDVLLAGGDEEASFFNNILHIQLHRRLRAMKRLAAEAERGLLTAKAICQFLVPLIENFVFQKKEDESLHNLAAEAVTTIGVLGEWIGWPQYKAFLRRVIRDFQESPQPERVIIRLLDALANALSKASKAKATSAEKTTLMGMSPHEVEDHAQMSSPEHAVVCLDSALSSSIPSPENLAEELMSKSFIPCLLNFLRNKDDSLVSVRVPVAIVVVKFLKSFPFNQLADCLPPVLTDLCHILRSRAAESRDMTRRTLAEIVTILGPGCFAFVVKELRGALKKGYQLHVLSFTLHSLLVAGTPHFGIGDLDYCLLPIVEIITDDVFGTVGEEKDATDYVSSMKEVKHNKSYDSMELLAKSTTISYLSTLIQPVKAALQHHLSLTSLRKIDELLRRVSTGITQNKALQTQGLLIFCYQLLKEATNTTNTESQNGIRGGHFKQRYIVALKGARKEDVAISSLSYQYKLVRFSMDILRNVLRKQDSLRTPSNIVGLVPLVDDALLNAQEEVKLSALRLLVVFIRVPLPELDRNLGVYISEAIGTIKASPTTNSELAQASIKLVVAILRENRELDGDERRLKSQIAYLLQRLKVDIEEPNRQGVTFNFLRAVLARKILVPEVYEILDAIASVMVTNHTKGTRDLARGVYFQFLMDYPQGKIRFTKQLSFLVKNMNYQHPEGRQSVLEVIYLMISKVGVALIQDIIGTFFAPLVMMLVNDDSSECRKMAGNLLRGVFERADEEKMVLFLSLLRKWIKLDENPLLVRAALQCYGFNFEARNAEGQAKLLLLQKRLEQILTANVLVTEDEQREVLQSALQLLEISCRLFPDVTYAAGFSACWRGVISCLGYPHPWVQVSAAKLTGLYLADFGRANSENGLHALPLSGSSGMKLDAEGMVLLADHNIAILEMHGVAENLATQAAKNLVFLGRCFGANGYAHRSANLSLLTTVSDNGQHSGEPPSDINEAYDEQSAMQHLFGRVCAVLRREVGASNRASLVPKTAGLQLVASLCHHLPPDALRPSLPAILLSLHHLTDDSISTPHSGDPELSSSYSALRSTSHEIIALLQQRLGTSELVARHVEMEKSVKERREDRRRKRLIETVTDPAKAERRKRKKEDRKKIKRKEKSADQRGKRRGW